MKAEELFNVYRLDEITVRVVTTPNTRPWLSRQQSTGTSFRLERAFMIAFRELYGVIPVLNRMGEYFRIGNEFASFAHKRLEASPA